MASPLRHFSVSPLWDVSNPAILRRPETREIEIRVNGNDLALDNFLYWGIEKKKALPQADILLYSFLD